MKKFTLILLISIFLGVLSLRTRVKRINNSTTKNLKSLKTTTESLPADSEYLNAAKIVLKDFNNKMLRNADEASLKCYDKTGLQFLYKFATNIEKLKLVKNCFLTCFYKEMDIVWGNRLKAYSLFDSYPVEIFQIPTEHTIKNLVDHCRKIVNGQEYSRCEVGAAVNDCFLKYIKQHSIDTVENVINYIVEQNNGLKIHIGV